MSEPILEVKGLKTYFYTEEGVMPAVDGLYALDCTHPAWEGYARDFIRGVAEEGFDYLKIDFLGHGSMEAKFADPSIRTGRQAYCHGMGILLDELLKQDHPIFLSLSIAPIFPYGFGHARRCCCDSFREFTSDGSSTSTSTSSGGGACRSRP